MESCPGQISSSQHGRGKNFSNSKCSAKINKIALDAVMKCGRMVMVAHSAQLCSPY